MWPNSAYHSSFSPLVHHAHFAGVPKQITDKVRAKRITRWENSPNCQERKYRYGKKSKSSQRMKIPADIRRYSTPRITALKRLLLTAELLFWLSCHTETKYSKTCCYEAHLKVLFQIISCLVKTLHHFSWSGTNLHFKVWKSPRQRAVHKHVLKFSRTDNKLFFCTNV